MYADTTKTNSWTSTSNNNGYSYISDYELGVGEKVSFKFNTVPSNFLCGLYSLSGTTRVNAITIQQEGTGHYIYKASGYETFSTSITTSTIVTIECVSATEFKFYIGNTLVKTITNDVANPRNIAFHKYNNKSYNMDWIKVE